MIHNPNQVHRQSGALGIATAVFMRETSAAVLLSRKADWIDKEAGNARITERKRKQQESPRKICRVPSHVPLRC
jgi:hypothetical protein